MVCTHRFFFALLTLCRFAVNLGFFERPLFVGFLWGMLTGEWTVSLYLSIFFELLWLDLFPVGTYIPPNAIFPLLLTLCASRYFSVNSPELLVIPLAISLPAAMLGAQIESFQRRSRNRSYNRLIRWGRSAVDARLLRTFPERNSPGVLITVSLLQIFLLHFIFFSAYMLVLIGTIRLISAHSGHLPVVYGVTWVHIWLVGIIGCVLSLRLPRSWVVFAIACFSVTFAATVV